jgi:hypothetical protein
MDFNTAVNMTSPRGTIFREIRHASMGRRLDLAPVIVNEIYVRRFADAAGLRPALDLAGITAAIQSSPI